MDKEALLAQLDKQRHKVDFDTYDITVQQLMTMVESGAIDVAPAYQRQFRWGSDRRSTLIESVFLGVPVPSLFMATNKDSTWELVDGVQRLSTLVQYAGTDAARQKLNLSAPLRLENLAKLTEFEGTHFSHLPSNLQLQFHLRPIKVITLSDKSDKAVRFDLFERLNTGGIALTDQEIRACIYRGPFNGFLEKLAAYSSYKQVVLLTERQQKDGTSEECVLRFFAYLDRYMEFDHSVRDFLNSFTKDASKSFDQEAAGRIFRKTFRYLSKVLPNGIVRRAGRKNTPLNLFEGVSVGAALALQSGKPIKRDTAEWLGDDELRKMTTGATNNRNFVSGRIEYCRDRFLA